MSHDDHIRGLEDKVRGQAERIRTLQTVEAFRKRQLDALHYVWCTGACETGVHRFDEHPPLTRALLADALGCVGRMIERVLSQEWRATAETLGRHTYQEIREAFDQDPSRGPLRELATRLRQEADRLRSEVGT